MEEKQRLEREEQGAGAETSNERDTTEATQTQDELTKKVEEEKKEEGFLESAKRRIEEGDRDLEEEQVKLRMLQGTITDLENYAQNCNRRVEQLENLFEHQTAQYLQLREEVNFHRSQIARLEQTSQDLEQTNDEQVTEEESQEQETEREASAKAVILAAKNTLAKVQLHRHQQDLAKLTDLLQSTRQILEMYKVTHRTIDIEDLLQKKIFITNRLNNVENALIEAGLLEKNKFGIQESVTATGVEQLPLSDQTLDKLEQKLHQDKESDVVWLHVYRTISQHLSKIDSIRQTHLLEQKKNLSKNKVESDLLAEGEMESIGMQPQNSTGFLHLQFLNGGAGGLNQNEIEEEKIPLTEVAGGLTQEEQNLDVNFESDQEENPYLQITDFFTSLTTVKYVLDCSNICADSFLAPKLDLNAKKGEMASTSEEEKQDDNKLKQNKKEELELIETYIAGTSKDFTDNLMAKVERDEKIEKQ